MSIMVTEVYEALVSAGAPEDKAKAAAGAIPIARDIATKQDLADLRTELKQDIAELRTELKQDIAELRTELKQDIAELKSDLKIMKFVYGPAVLLMLAKLVFFPG